MDVALLQQPAADGLTGAALEKHVVGQDDGRGAIDRMCCTKLSCLLDVVAQKSVRATESVSVDARPSWPMNCRAETRPNGGFDKTHCADILGDLLHYRFTFAAIAGSIFKWKDILYEHLKRFPEDIRQLPEPDEPPVRDLHIKMLVHAGAQAERDPRTREERVADARASRRYGPLKPWRPDRDKPPPT